MLFDDSLSHGKLADENEVDTIVEQLDRFLLIHDILGDECNTLHPDLVFRMTRLWNSHGLLQAVAQVLCSLAYLC